MEKDSLDIEVHLFLISTPSPMSSLRVCIGNFNFSTLFSFKSYILAESNRSKKELAAQASKALWKHRGRAAHLWGQKELGTGREPRFLAFEGQNVVSQCQNSVLHWGKIFMKTGSWTLKQIKCIFLIFLLSFYDSWVCIICTVLNA